MKPQPMFRFQRPVQAPWLGIGMAAAAIAVTLTAASFQQAAHPTHDACLIQQPECTTVSERAAGDSRHARILERMRMPFFSFARPLRGGRRL